ECHPLGADALRTLHTLLDTDMSAEHLELAERFHLGQPVALGEPRTGAPSVLRVALGARLITELATMEDAGAAWLRGQLAALRRKIERLVQEGRAVAA
ncbi:MAG: hypothetical protein AB8H79_15040, partial [Myxococcota bacterium]